jgi:hypothetical protein
MPLGFAAKQVHPFVPSLRASIFSFNTVAFSAIYEGAAVE